MRLADPGAMMPDAASSLVLAEGGARSCRKRGCWVGALSVDASGAAEPEDLGVLLLTAPGPFLK
jgi:hypothetical protein